MRTVEETWSRVEVTFMYLSRADRLKVLPALCVAALAHKDQKRKSGEPYLVHPVAVAELLASLKVRVDVVIAGLLHDTVEDNPEISFRDLEELFGRDVRMIVEGETKASKRTGMVRSDERWSSLYTPLYRFVFGEKWRDAVSPNSDAAVSKACEQAENLRDMFLAMADDYRVIIVKLADRLHNMRTLQYMPTNKRMAIAAETLAVFAPLAHRLGVWMFKSELEDLAFKHLFPVEYTKLDELLAMRRAQHTLTLSSAAQDLKEILRQDPKLQNVRVQITGREKGMYSLWHKLQRDAKYHDNLDNVTDIIALRVVLDIDQKAGETDERYEARGNELCYYALSLVYSLPGWGPPQIGVSFKDYIKYPKPNGYRSLHTILECHSAPVPLEVQIRTRQMHDVAEYGMAAHWAYKGEQHGEVESSDMRSRRVAWLASVQEKNKMPGADPIQFVQDVLREELGKRCFVFVGDGTVLNLSRGCTALDAAFKIGTDVGMHMVYPEVNGVKVGPSYLLKNGDCIRILTARDASPKWDWLDHAWLRSTQNQLIAYFRQQERDRENRRNMVEFAGGLATVATCMAAAASVVQAFLDYTP